MGQNSTLYRQIEYSLEQTSRNLKFAELITLDKSKITFQYDYECTGANAFMTRVSVTRVCVNSCSKIDTRSFNVFPLQQSCVFKFLIYAYTILELFVFKIFETRCIFMLSMQEIKYLRLIS